MDIKSHINESLYYAIQQNYEHKHFSDAVVNAIKFMTDRIRAKSRLDGDGASLVGRAFGGAAPPLKFNRMQTESETDEQKGMEQILRGIYIGIRNPRSHEAYADSREDCDSIVLFLDYLLRRIEATESFFNLEEYKKRIFDPLFVAKNEYAELLVAKIPSDDLVTVATNILEDRRQGNPEKLDYFFRSVFQCLDADQAQQLMGCFSRELQTLTRESDIIGLVRFIKPELWQLIAKDAKLRIEACMIESVRQGKYDAYGFFNPGALGTWTMKLGEHFTLRDDLAEALIDLLRPSWYTQNYVGEYFAKVLPSIVAKKRHVDKCCSNLCYATMSNNARILRTKLLDAVAFYPKQWKESLLEHAAKHRHLDEEYYEKLKQESEIDIPF